MTEERSSYEYAQNRSKGNMNAKNFLIGTLVGGIVGTITALLLAPKQGRNFAEILISRHIF